MSHVTCISIDYSRQQQPAKDKKAAVFASEPHTQGTRWTEKLTRRVADLGQLNSSRCRQERQEDKLPLLTSNSQLMEEPIKEAPHCLSALASCRAAQARRSSSRPRSKGTAVGSRGPVWRPAGSRAAAPARFDIGRGVVDEGNEAKIEQDFDTCSDDFRSKKDPQMSSKS